MSQFNLKAIEFQIASEVRCDAEGKGVYSVRAVARLADVADSSILRGLQGAVLEPSQLATTLISRGFEGAALEQFSKTGIPDIAAAIILEYYAFHAGRYCSEQAKNVFIAFAAIGIRAYSQHLTGWQPDGEKISDYKAALMQVLEEQLPREALPHQTRFDKRFWAALELRYGLKRGQWACSRFINCWVYCYFPAEVQKRLDEINPLLESGYGRKNKIHQHFDDVLLQLLIAHIEKVTLLLEVSPTPSAFRKSMSKIRKVRFNTNNVKLLKGDS